MDLLPLELGFELGWRDIFSTFWLFFCWVGYTVFARRKARKTFCIASVLHNYRKQWMHTMVRRDNRISDASLLSNLERNASFLASTAILIIAGLVTTLASIEKVHAMIMTVPFSSDISPLQLQFKIVVMLVVFIYAFFTFTWAMRQYGFCAVLVGAAPIHDDESVQETERERFAYYTAKVIDQAGHSYNYGLRAYYFSLSVLAWLLNSWVFLAAVAAVVVVLYGREFHSPTLRALTKAGNLTLGDMKPPRSWTQ